MRDNWRIRMRLAILAILAFLASSGFSLAGTQCNDGTYSNSNGSGTCSHHGGERK